MKTHQEIHDAIDDMKRLPLGMLEVETLKILHALNDRIRDLDASVTAAFNAIQDLDDSKAPR